MRKFLCWLILLPTSSLIAQNNFTSNSTDLQQKPQSSEWNNIISIRPIDFFVGGIRMGFEHFTSDLSSWRISAGYYFNEDTELYEDFTKYEGFNVNIQYKRYMYNRYSYDENIYLSPQVLYKQIELQDQDGITPNASAAAIVPGISIGFFMKFDDTPLTVEAALGGGFAFPIGDGDSDAAHIPILNGYDRGATALVDLSIGYAF